MSRWWLIFSCLSGGIVCIQPLVGQSIAEKKAAYQTTDSGLDRDTEDFLIQVNRETTLLRQEIGDGYRHALDWYEKGGCPEELQKLLGEIRGKKERLFQLQAHWRERVRESHQQDGYGLWHNPETTLEQLIIDYGSQDAVYLIPPQVGGVKLSVASNLPIPWASWTEVLELILEQNGIGVISLNPYVKQLFLVKEQPALVEMITNDRKDLELLSFPLMG